MNEINAGELQLDDTQKHINSFEMHFQFKSNKSKKKTETDQEILPIFRT